MNKVKLSVLVLLLCFCSIFSNAETCDAQPLKFRKKTETVSPLPGVVVRPLSLAMPPEGYLVETLLTIELNNASYHTVVEIERADEGLVCNDVIIHDADKVISYDLSMYGAGEYTISITFSDGDVYEATVLVE